MKPSRLVRLALHESGHATIARVQGINAIAGIERDTTGRLHGWCCPERGDAFQNLVVALAGAAAVRAILGVRERPSAMDMKQAEKYANAAAAESGGCPDEWIAVAKAEATRLVQRHRKQIIRTATALVQEYKQQQRRAAA